jgi:hypothetical protein
MEAKCIAIGLSAPNSANVSAKDARRRRQIGLKGAAGHACKRTRLSAVRAGQDCLANVADQIAVRRLIDRGVATTGVAGIELLPILFGRKLARV